MQKIQRQSSLQNPNLPHPSLRNRFWLAASAAASLVFMAALPASAATSALTIEVSGLRNQKGQVCLSVFNSSRGFPGNGGNAVKSTCVAANRADRITLKGIASGSYAVAILHDENADGQANKNRLGIPTEGFGFSRNPALRAGPPKYSEAVFIAGKNTAIAIQMTYLF
jgi:uncharacterized protein (DUF2141 family)